MSDVLVCAEPQIREEAARFVSRLGARPQACPVNRIKHCRQKGENTLFLLVYLMGTEPPATLRNCLRQISDDQRLDVVVYSHPASDHEAAELGKIVGQLRPKRTYMCFAYDEVEEFFQAHVRPAREKKPDAGESLANLRKGLHLTQVDLASALDVAPRTVQNWESRGGVSERRYRDLKELLELVLRYINRGEIDTWMDTPNDSFQKRTPRELIREGKTRDLILEFQRLQTGEPL